MEREERREERLRKRREAYRSRRDRESEEEWQTRLERRRYAAMNTEQRCYFNSTKKKEMVGHGSDGLLNRVLATL